ncbi:MAG: SRPBCC family protein, partial [Hyphomicrobium sp.]
MKKLALAAIVTALSATTAGALEAHYSKDTPAPAAKAWAAIGDFCGISAWHPALEKCEISKKDGATLRTLHLKGGGTVLEQLVEQNDKTMTQTYTILDGVLPVANYKSTLKVLPKGDGAIYDWSGSFEAKKASDADAVKTMNGVYSAGIDALVDKPAK